MFRRSVVMLLLLVSACVRAASERTPEGALSLFLEAMGEADDDPTARERAYSLLASESRQRLVARARLASALSSRRFEPWEMLAEGRYRLRFEPRESHGFEQRIVGDRAIVVVRGERHAEHAEVPMRLEHGYWRVYLAIPAIENARIQPAVVDAGVPPH